MGERVVVDGEVVSILGDGSAPEAGLVAARRFSLSEVVTRILWRLDDCSDRARRGHGYLLVRGGSAVLVRLTHGVVDQVEMMALLDRVAARVVPDSGVGKLRAWTSWFEPSGRWSFTMDAGAVEAALHGRAFVDSPGPDPFLETPIDLPEAFLRDPVSAFVERVAGQVVWPEAWRAGALRPRFAAARSGDVVVVTACRYGSVHESAGQDRTAAVMISRDGGRTFGELPWTLPLLKRMTPSGQWCWPPEQIDRVAIVAGETGPTVRIEWDDPWIDWEPGCEWQATWEPQHQVWSMAERG